MDNSDLTPHQRKAEQRRKNDLPRIALNVPVARRLRMNFLIVRGEPVYSAKDARELFSHLIDTEQKEAVIEDGNRQIFVTLRAEHSPPRREKGETHG